MSQLLKAWAVSAVLAVLAACGDSSIARNREVPDAGPTAPVPAATGASGGKAIRILSNRADLISGGDVLVEIVRPAGTAVSALSVDLNGRDVTPQFSLTADGRFVGLVTGLVLGSNTINARLPLGISSYTVINHPNGGPIIDGPQVQPWTCQAGAVDAQCNQPAVYSFLYISTSPQKTGFQTYDPAAPATDVANVTTDQGVTVPFIVRVERGYQDRDQYAIAALYQPGKNWTAASPQRQFNHKLIVTHGALCGMSYAAGSTPSVTNFTAPYGLVAGAPVTTGVNSIQAALGAGFAVMATALDNTGHACDVVLGAESLIMAKERVIEQYGTLRYTIGSGCSGGSLAAQWIANAYQGIYQGLLPTCSFPDAYTSATQIFDYHLLINYFGELGLGPAGGTAGLPWTPAQAAAVEGNTLPVNAVVDDVGLFPNFVPTNVCPGTTAATVYHPQNNPKGARCTPLELSINVFAPRSPLVWSEVEKKNGKGFAGIPLDNDGVQYGLVALQDGVITPDMFLDLNSKIGGLDIDLNPTKNRLVADQPALANAYRSGMINETNNMGATAIIDCRGPDPGAAHDAYRAFAVRARLDRENGGHGNQLIWEGPAAIFGDNRCNLNSLNAMDRWLSAVENDQGNAPLSRKIIQNKPADLTDRCYDGTGNQLSSDLCGEAVVAINGTPRTAAGDALTTDNNKCQLKPLSKTDDYGPVAFSTAQWSQLAALFPKGVCDFTKPGVGQQPTIPWQTYQDPQGAVIYGGTRLPPVPESSFLGWAGAAFREF